MLLFQQYKEFMLWTLIGTSVFSCVCAVHTFVAFLGIVIVGADGPAESNTPKVVHIPEYRVGKLPSNLQKKHRRNVQCTFMNVLK